MKRFAFRLQPLLNYREYLERLAQQGVARTQVDIRHCEQQIEQLKARMVKSQADLDTDMQKGLNARQFRQHYQFMGRVESDIRDELVSKEKLLKTLALRLETLKKKTIDRKVIEKLKQRRSEEYSQAFQKSEQKTLDEISSVKKAREQMAHAE